MLIFSPVPSLRLALKTLSDFYPPLFLRDCQPESRIAMVGQLMKDALFLCLDSIVYKKKGVLVTKKKIRHGHRPFQLNPSIQEKLDLSIAKKKDYS